MGCLDKVGLLYCSTNRIDEISGGEIQRVCIARAIYQNPKLLIADEPISQLDPKNAIKIMELFKYISQKKNIKIVMSLHQPKLGIEYCENIIGLTKGKIIFNENNKRITTKMLNMVYD